MTTTEAQHWLWIATLEGGALLYGCLVHNAERWACIPQSKMQFTTEAKGVTINVFQALVDTNEANTNAEKIRTQSILDLSGLDGPSIDLFGSCHRLIDGFGRRSRPTETCVAKTPPALSVEEWRTALDFLNNTLGIDFRRAADRLGTFDIFDTPGTNCSNPFISFEVEREEGFDAASHPKQFTLQRLGTAKGPLQVHMELELGDDRVFSQLIVLNSEQKRMVNAVPFSLYRMSVFDQSGTLLQFEEYPILLSVGLNMSSIGSEHIINDRLSRSSRGLGPEISTQASTVRTRSTSRSLIGMKDDAFEVHRTQMRALSRRIAPSAGEDRWFPKGVSHEVGVIVHFNKLLDGANARAATIVDPFFSVDTLKRVVARIESLDVNLTVVTSLRSIDPETNAPSANLLIDLRTALDELSNNKIPNATQRLRVINLVDGAEQAFHDRYFMLTPHEGERKVYLLSNSLNRMAGKWPFCMSKLDAAAAHDAAPYIDGLANGQDISRSTQPTVNFCWPLNDEQ